MKRINVKEGILASDIHVNTEKMIMSGGQISGENTEKTVKTLFKTPPVRNKKYIEWIRLLPCLICLKTPSDPHHVPLKGHSGKGTKTDDTRTIPLCHLHHVEYHNSGRDTFSTEHRLDYESTIKRLNTAWETKS